MTLRGRWVHGFSASAALWTSHAAAQSAPPPPETVNVVGRAPQLSRGASDFQLKIGELMRVPRENAGELLKLAPGIFLTNAGGDGHPEQVFLRGFDAREGQDIEFSVGGVPINEAGNLRGNGLADTHFIIPELVESLRVIEGPFDPRQGNFAVAGSADYRLGLARRGMSVKYKLGSWNTQRLLLLWGPEGEGSGTFGGAEIFSTDGYGQNRDAQRATAMGQFEGALGEKGSYRVTAQGYTSRYHSAGVVREDDFRSGRIGFYETYDARQGGDSSRYSIAADLESRSGPAVYRQNLFLILRSMRLRENFTGFLLDPQSPGSPLHLQRGDLLDLAVAETTLGARGSMLLSTTALGQNQSAELGYFVRGDHVDGTQHRLNSVSNDPYRLVRSLDSRLGDVGAFADVALNAGPYLKVRGGVRADMFSYDVLDRCAVGAQAAQTQGSSSCLSADPSGAYREPVSRASTASSAIMPRGSLLVGPFEHFTLSASYGQGIRSIDPAYVVDNASSPFATVTAYEGGAAYAGGTGSHELLVRSVFFQTAIDQDIIFNETVGRGVQAGPTTRTGWVGAARFSGPLFEDGPVLDQAANVTLVKSSYDRTHLAVPYSPNLVVRSDNALVSALPFSWLGSRPRGAVASGISYIGKRPLPYGERGDPVFTIDASASVALRWVELAVLGTNLLDSRYRLGEYNYASDFHSLAAPSRVPSRHFTAGAPRSVFVTLTLSTGEGS